MVFDGAIVALVSSTREVIGLRSARVVIVDDEQEKRFP